MNALEEAVRYFKGEVGFSRLFFAFSSKIESIGRVGGAVVLTKPLESEVRAISKWMGKDYSDQLRISISLERFKKRFEDTRFDGIDFVELVRRVTGKSLIHNKTVKEAAEEKRANYFRTLFSKYKSPNTKFLYEWILGNPREAVPFLQAYAMGKYTYIEHVFHAVSLLPLQEATRLPFFSQEVTKDPHGLDSNGLFLFALKVLAENQKKEKLVARTAEERNELMFSFGIMKDDVLNFVICTGLIAEKDGVDIGSWVEKCKEEAVHIVPLRDLNKVTGIYPKYGNNVFVVENSGVFSSILDEWKGTPPPLVCTSGQLSTAAHQLFKKIIQKNVTVNIFYSGDFDLTGLQIAEALKRRYPNQVKYWRYQIEDYHSFSSNVKLSVDDKGKLGKLQDEELQRVIKGLRERSTIVYQESFIYSLLKDMRKLIKASHRSC